MGGMVLVVKKDSLNIWGFLVFGWDGETWAWQNVWRGGPGSVSC